MIKKFKNLFKKQQKKQLNPHYQRGFKGAQRNRFTKWILSSFSKINSDIKQDLITLITRSRDLAKNNQFMRSHLNNMEKSVIGAQGFRLQSLVKNKEGYLADSINFQLQKAWSQFGKRSNGYITKDGQLSDIDFDSLILRSLIIDGEAFIYIDRKAKNKFGLSFALLDPLSIDISKNQKATARQNAIVAGVQIDVNYKPLKYYFRNGDTENYQVGKITEINANDVIHLYKHEFIGQVRGFPEICASIDSLKQLDDYAVAQLIAAKYSACQNVYYQQSGTGSGDVIDDGEDIGTIEDQVTPGTTSVVPKGMSVKSLTPTHPNTNFNNFVKAIVRRIASSVGVSYNRLAHDYQSVNYSSLRQASIDQGKTYATIQRFIVENWKTIEYELFVKSYLINTKTQLMPNKLNEYLNFTFISNKADYFDPAKDIIAVERRLALGLSNPIIQLEKRGLDPDQVLDGWQIWNAKCLAKNLNFNITEPLPLDIVAQFNQQATHIQQED